MAEKQRPSLNAGDAIYEEKLNTISSNLKTLEEKASAQTADEEQTTAQTTTSIAAKEQSAAATASARTSKPATRTTHIGRRKLGTFRSNSAFGFLVALIVAGVGYSAIFSPNLILVNIKEMYVNDLADATVALYTYHFKMLDHKIGKADCGDIESIKCKLSTMSRQQVKLLEKAGFTVNGEKVEEDNLDDDDKDNDKPESRYKVSSIEFPNNGGTASSGKQFEENTNKSSAMQTLVYSVFHPKSSFFMDTRYKERIKWRYDLTKDVTTAGSTEKDVDESFNESLRGDDEGIDDAGRAGGWGGLSLEQLASSSTKGQLENFAHKVGQEANSYTQLQCGFYTIGKAAHNATKTAKEHTVARFAMQYLKAADAIKQGTLASDEEIVANTLSAKVAWSSDGGYNGRNVTDSKMYRHVTFGESEIGMEHAHKYTGNAFDAIGNFKDANNKIVGQAGTAKATKGITGAPNSLHFNSVDSDGLNKIREHCLHGQTSQSKSQLKFNSCPALTMAAATPEMKGAVAGIAAGSDRVCPPPPKGIFLMYPISTVNATANALSRYVGGLFAPPASEYGDKASQDFSADTKGLAASDAIFAGTSIILGDMAMSRGMRPADKNSLAEYLKAGVEVKHELEVIARNEARKTPFDISNQYSFAGSLVRSFGIAKQQPGSVFEVLSKVGSFVPASIASLTRNAQGFYHIQPIELDDSRLDKEKDCDEYYANIGIEPDVACNVRYSMSKAELDAKVSSVLEYMLEAHPNETQQNIQELQQRAGRTDAERDIGDVQRQIGNAQQGSQAKMIDEKTGKANPHTEYEKFLDYCVNREDPWGRSAMVVRREQLSDEDKQELRTGRDKDGNLIDKSKRNIKDGSRIVEQYSAITEGASADQDWYTGKKCLEESEMLNNFRAYTMMCSVDGSYSGVADCTEQDIAMPYSDGFVTNNDILFTSWW